MRWQCPKCKSIWSTYALKQSDICRRCEAPTSTFQPYVAPADRVVRIGHGAGTAARPSGRTTESEAPDGL